MNPQIITPDNGSGPQPAAAPPQNPTVSTPQQPLGQSAVPPIPPLQSPQPIASVPTAVPATTFSAAPPTPTPDSGRSNMKKLLLVAAIIITFGVSSGVFAIATKSKDNATKTTPSSSGTAALSDRLNQTDSSSNSVSASPPVTTPLTQAISTDFGYTIQLNELVRNYPAKHPESGQETVLLKATISQVNPQYSGGSPYASDFRIVANGQEYRNSLSVANSELTAAGYAPMPTQSATKDTPVSGYIAFDVPQGSDKLTFRYVQKESKVIGSGQTIPAKNYDVPLN